MKPTSPWRNQLWKVYSVKILQNKASDCKSPYVHTCCRSSRYTGPLSYSCSWLGLEIHCGFTWCYCLLDDQRPSLFDPVIVQNASKSPTIGWRVKPLPPRGTKWPSDWLKCLKSSPDQLRYPSQMPLWFCPWPGDTHTHTHTHTHTVIVSHIYYQLPDRGFDLQQWDSTCNDSIKACSAYIEFQGKRRQMLLPRCSYTSTEIRTENTFLVAALAAFSRVCVCSAPALGAAQKTGDAGCLDSKPRLLAIVSR